MAVAIAGRYNELLFVNGRLAPNVDVAVKKGGVNAQLFSNRTKVGGALPTSIVRSDTAGNLAFYADPGYYDLVVGSFTVSDVVVPVDYELATSEEITTHNTSPTAHPGTFVPFASLPYLVAGPTGGDDRAIIQAGLSSGRSVQLKANQAYQISAKLDLFGRKNLTFDLKGSTIQIMSSWAAGQPMLLVENCAYIKVRNGVLHSSGAVALANRPTAIIESRITSATLVAGITPTMFMPEELRLGGEGLQMSPVGIRWTAVGSDQNNDQGIITKVSCENIDTPFKMEHSQSVGHMFLGCNISGAIDGVNSGQASFHWFGGTMVNLTGSCFNIPSSAGHSCSASGLTAESCNRLLTTPNGQVATSVALSDISFGCSSLNADTYAVIWGYQGALSLRGVSFGQPGAGQLAAKIRFIGVVGPSRQSFTIEGCAFHNYNGGAAPPRLPLSFVAGTHVSGTGIGNTFVPTNQINAFASAFESWAGNNFAFSVEATTGNFHVQPGIDIVGGSAILRNSGGNEWAILTGNNYALQARPLGDVLLGRPALATTATDGFPRIPGAAGPPTGVPTAHAGFVPMYYDTTNNKLYIYNGGWKSTAALV